MLRKAFRRTVWLALLAPLLFQANRGSAKDPSFPGYLESVGSDSIAIRLADRRLICARLPASGSLSSAALAARFRLGDQVEMTSKPIARVWQKSTSRYQYLELTALRLVAHPSEAKLAQILAGRLFHEGENLLPRPPSSAATPSLVPDRPDSPEFALASRVNLEYAAHLPNFVADETVTRSISTAREPQWTPFDTLESEITFQGDRTIRTQVRRNGKPWNQPFEALPGFQWHGGFGAEIKPVFDPGCPTTVEYGGRSQLSGRTVLEYRYSAPLDGCFSFFYQQYQRYNPARSGRVLVDVSTGNILQLEEDTQGFPVEFELTEREEEITWDSVKIGDESHWLPVRANCLAGYANGTRYRIASQFRNHRHFESTSNVTFH